MIKIEITYRSFSLEIWESDSQLSLSVHQGETCRGFEIKLLSGGSDYLIAENHRAVFTALKPDGKLIFNPCQIADNIIRYTLTPQTTAVAGLLSCQLRLYGENDALILSPRFTVLVRPSVYSDEGILESENEVGALTALVSQAQEAIDEVRQSLTNGAFVPQFSIGSVETLPAGHMAQVELSGSGENPVLSFRIPQGEQGQAEHLIPDTALSASSTRPVQNKVIHDALSKKVEKTDFELSIANFVEKGFLDEALSNFVEKEEFGNSMAEKQDKQQGKGLSSNDFSDSLKSKLEKLVGLEASAVSAEHIAPGAVSQSLVLTLPAASWADKLQTVAASGVTASNTLILSPHADSFDSYAQCSVRCIAQGNGSLTFCCEDVPQAELKVNVCCINK